MVENLPRAQREKQATWGESLFFYKEQTSWAVLKAAYWFVTRLKAMQGCKWKYVKSQIDLFFLCFFFFSVFVFCFLFFSGASPLKNTVSYTVRLDSE